MKGVSIKKGQAKPEESGVKRVREVTAKREVKEEREWCEERVA